MFLIVKSLTTGIKSGKFSKCGSTKHMKKKSGSNVGKNKIENVDKLDEWGHSKSG